MADANIDNLILSIEVQSNNAVRKLNNITKAINTLQSSMSNINTKGLNFDVGGSKNDGSNKAVKDISKTLNLGKIVGKLYFIRNYTKQIGRGMAQIVQSGIDYEETLNLWQVSNRNNLESARQFVREMNRAYGISEETLMNYQAIFKNMLGSIGDLSDNVSSKLSQDLTQMALDFSSLYNVSIESAMQKYQAVLSGQVRPIRSVSGYDITENTLKEVYEGAGGKKTVRQLSEIEKRLLRIVAVYGQMGESGAIGDLSKTINVSMANQIRMTSELWKETTTWIGISVKMLLEQNGIVKNLNAGLIVMRELFKAIAYENGYSEKNFLNGMFEDTEKTNEAIDELQGKLLSFDKFEALNSNKASESEIDPTITKLLEEIKMQTNQVDNETQQLADEWLNIIGLVDENGDGVLDITDKLKDTLDTLKNIGSVVGILIGLGLVKRLGKIAIMLLNVKTASQLLNGVLLSGTIYAFIKMVEAINKGDTATAILMGSLGALLGILTILRINGVIPLVKAIGSSLASAIMGLFKNGLPLLQKQLTKTQLAMSGLAFAAAYMLGEALLNLFPDGQARKTASAIMIVVGAVVALTSAILAAYSVISWGTALPILMASVGVAFAGVKGLSSQYNIEDIPAHANGGFVEDGLFFANSGEMVGKFTNGRTAVANNDQIVRGIQQGVYSAMMAYNTQVGGSNGGGDVYLDGKKVGVVTSKSTYNESARVGMVKVNR